MNVREGVLRGLYRFKAADVPDSKLRAQLLGSGTIMYEVLKAQTILEEKYGVAADVWSVTSYKELYRDANDCERWNMLHPGETVKVPYVTQTSERCARTVYRRIGLHEGASRISGEVGAGTIGLARDGWLSAAAKTGHRIA
jgi:pyruvate dehydrogenase complex dehydrogenase (E1) component